jgi:CheY-like chemotaxis protein
MEERQPTEGTVLVIDDEPDIVDLARMMLEAAGYSVISALSGEEGLEMIERHDPDLVLLDIRLPGISGWEVLDRLASSQRRARVIPISAHTSGHSLRRALRMGCLAYVTKPFRSIELLRAVNDGMRRPPPQINPSVREEE